MFVNNLKVRVSEFGIKGSLLSFLFVFILADASAQSPPDTLLIKQGDTLSEISNKLGDTDFWKSIYEANINSIDDPNIIYAGQRLLIPSSVTSSKKYAYNNGHDTPNIQPANESQPEDSSEVMQKFREVFEQVAKEGQTADHKTNEMVAKEQEIQQGLEIGGLIINRTISRMGRDFFKTFSDQWETPSEAGNFMLEVSEQPAPSMGALVMVKVDNQIVFKARLQPRNDGLTQKARQAIMMCYRYLHQQVSSTQNMSY